jgi:hypothetical protein
MKEIALRLDNRGRVRRSAEQRRELINRYEVSGLGKAEFCRQNGIHLGTFCQWFSPGARSPKRRMRGPEVMHPPAFAEVRVAIAASAPVEVDLPQGIRIRLRDAGLLAVVIREALAC